MYHTGSKELMERPAPGAGLDPGELRRHYFHKLATNGVGALVSFASHALVPRALGPVLYGNLGFLETFFTQLIGFLDAGSSTGFYNMLSKRPLERGLVRFYGFVVAAIVILCFGLVGIVYLAGADRALWPDQQAPFVLLAAGLGALAFGAQVVSSVVDARGQTVGGERVRLAQKVFGFLLLLAVFEAGRLGLAEYFLCTYAGLGFAIAGWWFILRRRGTRLLPSEPLAPGAARRYGHEFATYCAPLVAYSLVSFASTAFDRWLLQTLAGSVEQGFFRLGDRIAAVCFLFTSALAPLLMREFARAHGAGDVARSRDVFRRYVPRLYSVTAVVSAFVAVQASEVVRIFGGGSFEGATAAVAIMALYPVHQTYGQLSGSVFYATNRTRLYSVLGALMALVSVPLTVGLLGPAAWGCLGLGSVGLAWKMILTQLVAVNVRVFFNARFLGLSFVELLVHQAVSLGAFLGAATLVTAGVRHFVAGQLASFGVSLGVYAAVSAGIALAVPWIFVTTRAELLGLVSGRGGRG
jgi:O-antigen/teichoic acid export membrane protein